MPKYQLPRFKADALNEQATFCIPTCEQ